MKLSLRTGAGLASLLLVLFVAGTMARNGLVRRPPPPVARQASPSDPLPLSVQPLLHDVEATRQPVDVCGSVTSRATLFAFPFRLRAGERVRLIAISRERLAPFTAEVVGEAAGPSELEAVAAWGPGPYAWEFAAGGLAAGEYAVLLRQRGEPAPLGCATLRIDPVGGPRERVARRCG